jgi:hypothetical protein
VENDFLKAEKDVASECLITIHSPPSPNGFGATDFASPKISKRSLVEAAGIEPIFRFLNGKLTAALMKGEVVLALRLHITTGFFLIL